MARHYNSFIDYQDIIPEQVGIRLTQMGGRPTAEFHRAMEFYRRPGSEFSYAAYPKGFPNAPPGVRMRWQPLETYGTTPKKDWRVRGQVQYEKFFNKNVATEEEAIAWMHELGHARTRHWTAKKARDYRSIDIRLAEERAAHGHAGVMLNQMGIDPRENQIFVRAYKDTLVHRGIINPTPEQEAEAARRVESWRVRERSRLQAQVRQAKAQAKASFGGSRAGAAKESRRAAQNAGIRMEETNIRAAEALGGKVRGGSGAVGRVGRMARGLTKTRYGKLALGAAAFGVLATLVSGRDREPAMYQPSDTYYMR